MKNVFVYGTLMRGERAARMLSEGNYKGEYVLKDYAMYDLGPFPGIKEKPGEKVLGEVFEVSDSVIPQLDAYEGEGDLYKRIPVSVESDKQSLEDVLVYVYLGNCQGEVVRTKWNAYKRTRRHQ